MERGQILPLRSEILRIVQHVCSTKKHLGDDVELYHDLSLFGDDAYEIFEEIHNKYGTDFGKFEFSDYFPNETEPIYHWRRKIFGYRDRNRKSFTFGHLVRVVEVGTWFSPDL